MYDCRDISDWDNAMFQQFWYNNTSAMDGHGYLRSGWGIEHLAVAKFHSLFCQVFYFLVICDNIKWASILCGHIDVINITVKRPQVYIVQCVHNPFYFCIFILFCEPHLCHKHNCETTSSVCNKFLFCGEQPLTTYVVNLAAPNNLYSQNHHCSWTRQQHCC